MGSFWVPVGSHLGLCWLFEARLRASVALGSVWVRILRVRGDRFGHLGIHFGLLLALSAEAFLQGLCQKSGYAEKCVPGMGNGIRFGHLGLHFGLILGPSAMAFLGGRMSVFGVFGRKSRSLEKCAPELWNSTQTSATRSPLFSLTLSNSLCMY